MTMPWIAFVKGFSPRRPNQRERGAKTWWEDPSRSDGQAHHRDIPHNGVAGLADTLWTLKFLTRSKPSLTPWPLQHRRDHPSISCFPKTDPPLAEVFALGRMAKP